MTRLPDNTSDVHLTVRQCGRLLLTFYQGGIPADRVRARPDDAVVLLVRASATLLWPLSIDLLFAAGLAEEDVTELREVVVTARSTDRLRVGPRTLGPAHGSVPEPAIPPAVPAVPVTVYLIVCLPPHCRHLGLLTEWPNWVATCPWS